jgi:hypothetical protein
MEEATYNQGIIVSMDNFNQGIITIKGSMEEATYYQWIIAIN